MQLPTKSKMRGVSRLAIQSSVAAAAMYTLMRSLGLPEVFVGVLSAVLIVQPTVGSTLGSGMKRILATVVGCGIGVVTIWAIPYGYGTAASLAISMLVMNTIAGFQPEWRYGVVAAVALSLGAESDLVDAAIDRSLSIGLGAAVGIVTSFVVWPQQTTTRARRRLADAMELLSRVVKDMTDPERQAASRWHDQYRDIIREVNLLLSDIRLADDDPILRRRDAVEQLYESIIVLGRAIVVEEHDDGNAQRSKALNTVHDSASEAIGGLAEASRGDGDSDTPVNHFADNVKSACDEWTSSRQNSENSAASRVDYALEDLCTKLTDLSETVSDTKHD